MPGDTEECRALWAAVKRWCAEHAAQPSAVGRKTESGAWFALVTLDDGVRVEAISEDPAQIVETLTRNVRHAREGKDMHGALQELMDKWHEMTLDEDDPAVAWARKSCIADVRELLKEVPCAPAEADLEKLQERITDLELHLKQVCAELKWRRTLQTMHETP